MKAVYVVVGLILAWATIKEWVYDANFEIPKQTWKDNLLDFSMYVVGVMIGLGVVFLKEYLK